MSWMDGSEKSEDPGKSWMNAFWICLGAWIPWMWLRISLPHHQNKIAGFNLN